LLNNEERHKPIANLKYVDTPQRQKHVGPHHTFYILIPSFSPWNEKRWTIWNSNN